MHLSSLCDLSWCLETISAAAISSTYSHLLGKLKLWKPDEILDVDGEVFSLAQQGLSADERDGQLCDRQKQSKPSRPGSSLGINRTREILCPPCESLEHVLKSWHKVADFQRFCRRTKALTSASCCIQRDTRRGPHRSQCCSNTRQFWFLEGKY